MHWLDSLTSGIAPRWTLTRMRARTAVATLARHYEAAAASRRTQGWIRPAGDANAAAGTGLHRLRETARDLVRNNCYARNGLATIIDHTVGWGIVASTKHPTAQELWTRWAETTACDADGRQDFSGLQKQVMRTVVEAGEVLVRRRIRRPEDRLPIPLQLQILEPDFLDTAKDGFVSETGRIIQGVEFNPIGQRIAYWLFREHPGANLVGGRSGISERIPASEILHIFEPGRPGQVRGVSWFATVILRLKDFDDYEDAALMKQKIAACLAVVTSDLDGSAPALGATDPAQPEIDSLEPGMILNAPPGRTITVVQPPTIREHADYAETVLRAVAGGLGVTYEDMTGDYTDLPFSAARMSRLRHWGRVDDWRWRMLIPQFCDPVWAWAMGAAAVVTDIPASAPPAVAWTAPPMPLLDPDKEGLALQRLVRIGALTWPEMIRERGYDPEAVLAEIAEWNAKIDAARVVLDSDPRQTSQQGQPRNAESVSANGNGGVNHDATVRTH